MQKTKTTKVRLKGSRKKSKKESISNKKFQSKPRQDIKVLFLDDSRDPYKMLSYEKDNIFWAKNKEEFLKYHKDISDIDIISIDCNLKGEDPVECLSELISLIKDDMVDLPQVMIHYLIEDKKKEIERLIGNYNLYLNGYQK